MRMEISTEVQPENEVADTEDEDPENSPSNLRSSLVELDEINHRRFTFDHCYEIDKAATFSGCLDLVDEMRALSSSVSVLLGHAIELNAKFQNSRVVAGQQDTGNGIGTFFKPEIFLSQKSSKSLSPRLTGSPEVRNYVNDELADILVKIKQKIDCVDNVCAWMQKNVETLARQHSDENIVLESGAFASQSDVSADNDKSKRIVSLIGAVAELEFGKTQVSFLCPM